jgi:ParB-like chromosome segregation protein Spo0J
VPQLDNGVTGTAVAEGKVWISEEHGVDADIQELVDEVNKRVREAYELLRITYPKQVLTKDMPVGAVQWIHISRIQANDYNPNSVANQEMRLLHTSIFEDGYTQPVVAMYDPDAQGGEGRYIIVDGFHRYTTMKRYQDIYDSTNGYMPVVVIEKSIEDRIASTVRHNRARGKHSVQGMGSLVFSMLSEGVADEEICNKLGLEAEELARLKHVTGYSKLYRDIEYSKPMLTTSQLKAKAKYKEEHPDEHIPSNF